MNKIFKISIFAVIVILVLVATIYGMLFIVGSHKYDSVIIDKVTVNNNQVVIKGEYTDSKRAFKEASYTQVGSELYITLTSVLVSKKYSSGNFVVTIPTNGVQVSDIHLTDGKATKVIYSKNSLVK